MGNWDLFKQMIEQMKRNNELEEEKIKHLKSISDSLAKLSRKSDKS